MTNRQATFIIKYKNIGIITGRGIAFYRDDIDMKHPTGGSFMKQKKLVLTGLTVGVVGFSAAFVGCKGSTAAKPLEEGPETGTYYYEDEYGENLLTLSGGQYFTFNYRGENLSGKYKLKDGAITLDFSKKGEEDAVGTLEETVLSFTYNGASVRFLKNVAYKVTFNSNGGSEVAAKNVKNGKTLAKPADPTKTGNKFIGWYKDKDCKGLPFSFETDAITANTDLYALWVAVGENDNEFKINFDLGYEAAAPEAMTTVAGKLYNVAEPTREGYTFKGWWLSSYNDGDKLTAKLTDSTVFDADTTLYAVWAQGDETAPLLSVTQNGAEWEGVTTSAKITIAGPDGLKVTENVGTTAGNRYAYDFAKQAAGDYTVTLEAGGKTATAYYLNGALARVSDLRVVGNAVLMWNPVAGAEKYVVSVKCGNANHEHLEIDNGTSTNFNFVNCAMKEGGIEFTVKALASGKATSVASYTFDRTLAKPENLSYNATTGKLTWNAVREAADYIVTVGEEAYNVGNKTEFSLKGYTGDLEISVVCKTDGYNTSAAATLALTKETPASPANLQINGDNLTWGAVENATGYVVRIGNNEFEVKDPTFDLAAKFIELNKNVIPAFGSEYTVAVKAKFENGESLYSDDLDVLYYAMQKSLKYDKGVLSWDYVVGATEYEVKVNGKSYTTEENEYEVTLDKEGENLLEVTYKDADGNLADNWVTYTVNAYKLTFDATSGSAVPAVYKAVGDKMDLPSSEREGFDFAGWYNAAAANNAKLYDDEYFYGNADYVLYAGWNPKTYAANLDYNEKGEGTATVAAVTYTKDYYIAPPTVKESFNDKIFVGWYSSADGTGVQYTDELGNSLRPWQHTSDMPLFAVYKDAFKYVEYGKGYEITANPLFASTKISELVIPATYNGKNVISIGEYAFKDCRNLTSVKIPDTVTFIASTAFYNCTKVERYEVYDNGAVAPTYYSDNGSLLYKNPIAGGIELMCVPSAANGSYSIPYGVTRLNSKTFYRSNVTEVTVPASVVEVAQEAFLSCKQLTKLSFAMPEGDQELVSLEFSTAFVGDCTALEILELPARVKAIDNLAESLSAYKKLKEINVIGECDGQVYASLTEEDGLGAKGILCNADKSEILYCPIAKEFNSVADGENVVKEFVVPNIVTKIAPNAFNMYKQSSESRNAYYNLNRIVFHSGIVSIGEEAFLDMRYLKSVTFKAGDDPLGMTIGAKAFYGCFYINELTFEETGALEGTTFVPAKTCGVKEIGAKAFYDTSVKKLLLPGTLTKIGDSAFEDSDALTEIDFSHVRNDLVYGAHIFASCGSLAKVSITDNVGPMEFSSVFYKCSNLGKVEVSPNNENYESDADVLYSKGKETLLYYPDGKTGEFTIPAETKRIGGGVFRAKSNITRITIPANVIEIGENAFEKCANLTEVIFAAPAENEQAEPLRIGDGAFCNCTALTSIMLPARTESIGVGAFTFDRKSDSALAEVVLNEGLETIGDSAFARCGALTNIVIPSSVNTIGKSAFSMSGLTTVNFEGSGELALGTYVFYLCEDLASVTFREGTKNIPEYTFAYDANLTTVVIPTTVTNDSNNGVRAIASRAFQNCTALTTVTFTKGGTLPLSFASGAFWGCTALTELNLPKRASSFNGNYDLFEFGEAGNVLQSTLANRVFCENPYRAGQDVTLARVNVMADDNVPQDFVTEYASYDGALYSADLKTVVWIPYGRTGNVEISRNATSFRDGAAFGCGLLESVTFEKGGESDFTFKSVDYKTGISTTKHVFFACPSLKSIAFPARLTSIGDYALFSASSNREVYGTVLEEVTFEAGTRLESIGAYAFGNSMITEFTVPDSVTKISKDVFNGSAKLETLNLSATTDATMLANLVSGVPNLKAVNIPAASKELASDEYGVVYDTGKTNIAYVPLGFDAAEYEVPYTVTTINASTFKNVKSLKKVVFANAPEGKTAGELTFGASAFEASGLTEITLPARTKSLGNYIFRNCTSLVSVNFEDGYACGSLPTAAFYGCSALTDIRLPGEITSIGTQVFYNNAALETVTFGIKKSGEVNQLTRIGGYAFFGCSSLATLQTEQPVKDSETGKITGVTYVEKLPDSITEFGNSDNAATGNGPFTKCTSLQSITIPDGVENINGSAFSGCTALETVNLPKSLKTIYSSAFSGCTSLKTVNFNKDTSGVTIQQKAFLDCSSLESFDFTKVGSLSGHGNIFQNCTSLKSVTIGENVTKAGGVNLFDGCTALKTVEFKPGDATTTLALGTKAFLDCTALEKAVIGDKVTKIGSSAFENCTALTTFTIDGANAALTTVDSKAFLNCTSLKQFVFPSSVTTIGGNAFEGTESLTAADFSTISNAKGVTIGSKAYLNSGVSSVTFTAEGNTGKSVAEIKSNAFQGCANLTSVTVPDAFAKGKLATAVFMGCTSLESVTWDSSLPIPMNSFNGCTALTNVSINDDVTAIGTTAFKGCTSLENITLPSKLTKLGQTSNNITATSTTGVFQDCAALKSIVLPVGITALGKDNFDGCTALTTVTVNGDLSVIGELTFNGCTNARFVIPESSTLTLQDGALYSGTTLISYLGSTETLNVKDGTEKIGSYAFAHSEGLEKVVLPQSVTTFGFSAFKGSNLTEINLEGVTTLDQYALSACNNLTSVKLSATSIPKYLFKDSIALETVEFTGSDITILDYAFDGCIALSEIKGSDKVATIYSYAFRNAIQSTDTVLDLSNARFNGNTSQVFKGATKLTAITIKGVQVDYKGVETKKIPTSTFEGCTSLTDITIKEKVTLIESSAFKNCVALNFDSVDFSEVTKIGSNVFQNCEKMTAISLPKLTSLGSTSTSAVKITANVAVFSGCTRLTTVSLGSGVTVLGKNVFFNCSALTTVLMPGVTQIGQYAFAGCSGLTSLTLTSAVTAVDANAFDGWLETQTINLPDYEEGNLPSAWDAAWNAGCNAKIVYKKAQATA